MRRYRWWILGACAWLAVQVAVAVWFGLAARIVDLAISVAVGLGVLLHLHLERRKRESY